MRYVIQSCGPKLILIALTIIITACGGAAEETPPAPTSTPEPVAPAEVEAAREAALDFLREGANCIVPPEGTAWHTSTVTNEATSGAAVYRFTTDTCAMTVSFPDPAPEEPLYYVALRNADFCWQAVVDRGGQVVATGYEQMEPDFVNPARIYCQQQGGAYELRTLEDGSLCSACVFEDGRMCNAWDFFYGECTTATGG